MKSEDLFILSTDGGRGGGGGTALAVAVAVAVVVAVVAQGQLFVLVTPLSPGRPLYVPPKA